MLEEADKEAQLKANEVKGEFATDLVVKNSFS
jgi:hypothetical protein